MIAYEFLCRDRAGLQLVDDCGELGWMGTTTQWQKSEEYINWFISFGSYKWQEQK